MTKTRIHLGDKVKCRYTGYQGIVVARTEFINGCIQMSVAQKYDKKSPEGSEEMPIDEASLIILDTKLRKKTKQKIKEEEETLEALEDEGEEDEGTGGASKRIKRRRRRNF